jgi:hypothetical protein
VVPNYKSKYSCLLSTLKPPSQASQKEEGKKRQVNNQLHVNPNSTAKEVSLFFFFFFFPSILTLIKKKWLPILLLLLLLMQWAVSLIDKFCF